MASGDPGNFGFFPDMPLSAPALRHCDYCDKGRDKSQDVTLRRCAGCSRAMYCSKECQKAAWPIHRAQCRTGAKMAAELLGADYSTQKLAPYGFPSLQAFSDVVSDFVESHFWAWHAIVRILVKRGGGIAWSQTPPKFLMFNLSPTPMLSRPRAERNPATTFMLDYCQFWDLNSFHAFVPGAAMQWAEWEESRRHVERSHRSNKLYAGLLPVQFKVSTVDIMTMCHYIPQFNPSSDPRPEHADFVNEKIMGNVHDVCVASINSGFPLRADRDNRLLVLPGQFTYAPETSWTWHPLYSDWEDYQAGGHEGYDAAMERINPVIPPPDLMKAFLLF